MYFLPHASKTGHKVKVVSNGVQLLLKQVVVGL